MTRFNPLDHPICLAYPRWIAPSEWIEHVPFAMLLIDLLRPDTFVELGAHYGVSYCAFCQAVEELHLPTRCYAVDTWEGDPHDGFYGPEVLNALRQAHDASYGSFSRLIQSTFDEALDHFADGTIDLLHIDGYHSYEAVMHDFTTWQPKLSPRAVVLFHDINVRERDFGAWRTWEELSGRYPHFAFDHGHGLGVLAVGPEFPEALRPLLDAPPEEARLLRELFYQLGLRLRARQERDRTVGELQQRLSNHEARLEKAEEDVATLHGWVADRDDQIVAAREKYDQDVRAYQGWLSERDALLEKAQTDIQAFRGWLSERDVRLRQAEEQAAQRNARLHHAEERAAEHEAHLQQAQAELDDLRARTLLGEALAAEQGVQLAKALEDATILHGWVVERDALIRQLWADKHSLVLEHDEFAALRESISWRVMQRFWRARARLLPHDAPVSRGLAAAWRVAQLRRQYGGRELARRGVRRLLRRGDAEPSDPARPAEQAPPLQPQPKQGDTYQRWIAENEPGHAELMGQREAAATLPNQPLISVLTPVYNPPPEVLAAAIESVLAQTYGTWELCLVNGSPANRAVVELLERYAAQDARVRVLTLEENRGIVGNTNAGLECVQGAFIAFLDHDDTLAPSALFEVASLLSREPNTDLIYTDSDLLSPDGVRRYNPLFKPDWSPAIMLSANYATHLCVVRAELVRDLGGLTPGSDGAQDWDLILRVSERTSAIAHIPKVLYHWRESPQSTATDIKRKPYVMDAQLKAIAQHLARKGVAAKAFFDTTGFIRVTWPLRANPLVSVIIPSRNLKLLERCVSSVLARTTYRNFELILVDTTPDGAIAARYRDGGPVPMRVLEWRQPFNYSAVNNAAARNAQGEVLLFLNDDTAAIDPDWLSEMLRWAELDEVGVVGPKLLHANGNIQHAGVVVGMSGFAGHPFSGGPQGVHTIYGCVEWYRNYSAVTGACLMIRRQLFEQVGGFDETLVLCGNDVELCLRVGASGRQIFYTPFARLYHLESATRGVDSIPAHDFAASYAAYLPLLEGGDPFFNPNLSPWSPAPKLRERDEERPATFARRHVEQLGLADLADELATART